MPLVQGTYIVWKDVIAPKGPMGSINAFTVWERLKENRQWAVAVSRPPPRVNSSLPPPLLLPLETKSLEIRQINTCLFSHEKNVPFSLFPVACSRGV